MEPLQATADRLKAQPAVKHSRAQAAITVGEDVVATGGM